MSLCVTPLLSFLSPFPHHTHTHTVLLTISPPIVCPSNDSQDESDGMTALDWAIKYDGAGKAGCAECVALLRAAGAQ
jgi:ankyrin repeat protein